MNRLALKSLLPLLAAAAGAASAAEPFALDQAERQAFGIRLAEPESVREAVSSRLPARVAVPNKQLRVVSAPQAGLLEIMLVAAGDEIEAGQPLARIRSPELLALQRDYLEALARLELAGKSLERDRMLYEEGIISERRYQTTRSERISAEATLEQRRQRLQLAGLDEAALAELEQSGELTSSLEVRAPMAGVVLEQMGTPGQRVDAADPVYKVGHLDPLWLEIHTPLELLSSIERGGRVLLPAHEMEGRVITIGRNVHGTDQGVLVRAEVGDSAGRLRPGQFVEAQVCMECGVERPAYRVPRAAVVRESGTPYVFERIGPGFLPRPIEVITEEDDSLIIEADLPAGARIAVAGTAALKGYWLKQREGN